MISVRVFIVANPQSVSPCCVVKKRMKGGGRLPTIFKPGTKPQPPPQKRLQFPRIPQIHSEGMEIFNNLVKLFKGVQPFY
jgi:hypothetical protein